MIHRRTFFKAGIGGALFLSGAYSLKNVLCFNPHPDYKVFDEDDIATLKNLVPAMLSGAPIEDAAIDEVIRGIEIAILGLPQLVQKEIRELFLLFKLRPAKWILGFDATDIENTKRLLREWRTHRTQTMRAAYGALSELINASYYASPKTWELIGYPSPLESSV